MVQDLLVKDVVSVEELEEEGISGFYDAALHFDPAKGTKFTTYAWYWIRKRVQEKFDDLVNGPMPMSMLDQDFATDAVGR